jgi:hypothetical protein
LPTITQQDVRAYAHCRNARCPGYAQQEIAAVREESSQTFGENGGDGVFTHMPERSVVEYRFADPEDVPCPVCSAPREVTGDPRPQYQPLSGHDPLGLLQVPRFDAGKQAERVEHIETGQESELELEARIRRQLLAERLEAKLRAEIEAEGE